MKETVLHSLALLAVLGIGAQWVAWRVKLPSILLLLLAGFVAGPVMGWMDPDALLGDLLMPVVSLSVGVILFEGGLTLKVGELRAVGGVVRNLVTYGAAVAGVLTGLAAYFCLGWSGALSTLIGGILVVTGPTVIMPILRHLKLKRQVASILKWEGIVIDPIGALLALLVFEAIRDVVVLGDVPGRVVLGVIKMALVGGLFGALGALGLYGLFKRRWVPDYLENSFSLMVVLVVFAVSNTVQHESGLLATTLMGIFLANQRAVDMRHILEFKENIRVLLISALFILLAARLSLEELKGVEWGRGLVFLGCLIFVVRPVSVWLSCWGSGLSREEKFMLAWMAPRGIVAAAVASIFALRLRETDMAGVDQLVPVTFLVIVGTVLIYGVTSGPLSRFLKLSNADPQGILIAGAHPLARAVAKVLQGEGVSVMLVDNNRYHVAQARFEGLPTYYGNILSERVVDDVDLAGIGRLVAMTPNSEVNSLAVRHFSEVFGRANVFQVPAPEVKGPGGKEAGLSEALQGRRLFSKEASFPWLMDRFVKGHRVKKTALTEAFDYKAMQEYYGGEMVPMFVLMGGGKLRVVSTDWEGKPMPGQALVSLVRIPEQQKTE